MPVTATGQASVDVPWSNQTAAYSDTSNCGSIPSAVIIVHLPQFPAFPVYHSGPRRMSAFPISGTSAACRVPAVPFMNAGNGNTRNHGSRKPRFGKTITYRCESTKPRKNSTHAFKFVDAFLQPFGKRKFTDPPGFAIGSFLQDRFGLIPAGDKMSQEEHRTNNRFNLAQAARFPLDLTLWNQELRELVAPPRRGCRQRRADGFLPCCRCLNCALGK